MRCAALRQCRRQAPSSPQASLFGYKVFPIARVRSHAPGASSADIADAIDFAIEDGVDVLNLSLGALRGRPPKAWHRDKVHYRRTSPRCYTTVSLPRQRAGDTRLCRGKACVLHDAGIVCCCAAGNDNSTVSYPAALNLENVVSVAVESHGEAARLRLCAPLLFRMDSFSDTKKVTLATFPASQKWMSVLPPARAIARAR